MPVMPLGLACFFCFSPDASDASASWCAAPKADAEWGFLYVTIVGRGHLPKTLFKTLCEIPRSKILDVNPGRVSWQSGCLKAPLTMSCPDSWPKRKCRCWYLMVLGFLYIIDYWSPGYDCICCFYVLTCQTTHKMRHIWRHPIKTESHQTLHVYIWHVLRSHTR